MIILHSLFPLPPTRSSPQLCDGLINALYLEKNMPLRSSLLLCQRWVTHAGQVQERPERALISASVPAYMATSAPRNQSSVVSRELLLSCAALLREVILRTCSTHTHTHGISSIYLFFLSDTTPSSATSNVSPPPVSFGTYVASQVCFIFASYLFLF